MEKYKEVFIPCDCRGFHFLRIGDFGDEQVCVTITFWPKSILGKIKGIIEILKGSGYNLSEEVIISRKDTKKIIKFLKNNLV